MTFQTKRTTEQMHINHARAEMEYVNLLLRFMTASSLQQEARTNDANIATKAARPASW